MSQPDTLREKLEGLVEEWQLYSFSAAPRTLRMAAKHCAHQLAAILAESEEPEPREPRQFKTGGKKWDLPAGQTHYVGDDCEGGHAEVGEMLPAKLPLGHKWAGDEYAGASGECVRTMDYSVEGKCWIRCGQPRSAHEAAPDAGCVTTPDGDCRGTDCTHMRTPTKPTL